MSQRLQPTEEVIKVKQQAEYLMSQRLQPTEEVIKEEIEWKSIKLKSKQKN